MQSSWLWNYGPIRVSDVTCRNQLSLSFKFSLAQHLIVYCSPRLQHCCLLCVDLLNFHAECSAPSSSVDHWLEVWVSSVVIGLHWSDAVPMMPSHLSLPVLLITFSIRYLYSHRFWIVRVDGMSNIVLGVQLLDNSRNILLHSPIY